MAAATDPFNQVRDEVQASLEQAKSLYESFKRISQTSNHDSPEVRETLEDLVPILDDLDQDVVELQQSVDVMAHNTERYALSNRELERRRGFVKNVKQEVLSIRAALSGQNKMVETNRGGIQKTDEDGTQGRPDKSRPEDPRTNARSTDEQEEEQYQQQLMQDQDLQLDGVFATVGNLRLQANAMGQELGEQAEMLEEFEVAVDVSQNKLRRGMKQVEVFLKRNEDTKSSCCIAVLIMILIVLLVLVILV